MSHVRTVRVRGYHCDFYGHVNQARYLELLEEARWSLLEDRLDLADWERRHLGIVVAGVDIRYLRPAVPDDLLDIHSAMVELGTKTGVIRQRVVNQATAKTIAEADVTFAVVDRRTGRAIPLAGDVRDLFTGAEGEGADVP